MLGITILVLCVAMLVGGVLMIINGVKRQPVRKTGSVYDKLELKPFLKIGGVCLAILGVLVLIFSGIRSVPVKSVGVLTSFGHVEGDLTPGHSNHNLDR
jgi:nitrate reductase gamma subunit